MDDWRVILQFEGPVPSSPSSCARYPIAGVAFPAHISVEACDKEAKASAFAVHAEIDAWLCRMGARGSSCDGPRGMTCMAWSESSCQHVLLLVIGSPSLPFEYERKAIEWRSKNRGHGIVITALVPPLTHAQVFSGGRFPILSSCQVATWGGVATQLARSVLVAAVLDEKPGVFISYLRKEASAGAEDIHDALTHSGYRVFLDRFNGTPGRVFYHELAEAMASMGLVVLLETSGLRGSRWTMWEVAFARRFRLGPVAVNFGKGQGVVGGLPRHVLTADPRKTLPAQVVDGVLQFIRDQSLAVAVSRRAYYETLVRIAAKKEGGDATDIGGGVLSLDKPVGNSMGYALPAGVPGRLRHVARLVQNRNAGPSILVGEHHNLAPADREDLRWLASISGVTLVGSGSVYNAVKKIL